MDDFHYVCSGAQDDDRRDRAHEEAQEQRYLDDRRELEISFRGYRLLWASINHTMTPQDLSAKLADYLAYLMRYEDANAGDAFVRIVRDHADVYGWADVWSVYASVVRTVEGHEGSAARLLREGRA